MCEFTPDLDRSKPKRDPTDPSSLGMGGARSSPDRADALVWAFTELLVEEIASWGISTRRPGARRKRWSKRGLRRPRRGVLSPRPRPAHWSTRRSIPSGCGSRLRTRSKCLLLGCAGRAERRWASEIARCWHRCWHIPSVSGHMRVRVRRRPPCRHLRSHRGCGDGLFINRRRRRYANGRWGGNRSIGDSALEGDGIRRGAGLKSVCGGSAVRRSTIAR